MQIKFSNKGMTLVTYMNGEIDHHWAEYLRDKIDSEILKSRTRNVIFDFENVSFMDSSGIGVLLGRYKNVKRLNGKVAAVNLNHQLARIFEMAGLKRLIPIYDNLDNALLKIQEVSI